MYNNVYLKSFEFFLIFLFWFLMLYVSEFLMNFLHIFRGRSFGLQSFSFHLKIFKLSAFFNSAGKSFQRIVPIVLSQNQTCSSFCFFYSR